MKGSRLLYRTTYKLGVPSRVFYAYGHSVKGVTDPGQASWLSVRDAKQIRAEMYHRLNTTWYVLSREETLVYAVMNT